MKSAAQISDRRVEKTRAALLSAFNKLLFADGYEKVTPARIAQLADVGRSTLYEHFTGKEELLQQSLLPVLRPLSECVDSTDVPPGLEPVLTHIWESRGMARALLTDRARTVAARTLAKLIEERLRAAPGVKAALPPSLVAAHVAGGMFAVLDEWLGGREACSPSSLARGLHQGSRSAAASMLRNAIMTNLGSVAEDCRMDRKLPLGS